MNSAYFRVSKVEVLGNTEIFDEADLIKPALGQSIWLVNNDTFTILCCRYQQLKVSLFQKNIQIK